MKVTILLDNETESEKYLTEHGFSCWIETETPEKEPVRILFDTGQSDIFLTNAARLGADMKSGRYVVISHGHYDHGGGLSALLREAPHSCIYISSKAFDPHVKGDEGEMYYYAQKNVGLSPSLKEKHEKSFSFIEKESALEENILILTAAPQIHPAPPNTALCEVDGEGKMRKDRFEHEIYLAVREGKELFLFTGCAHRGIANIAALAESRFPGMDRYTIIGGFHIKNDPSGTQIDLLEDLTASDPGRWRFVSGHCSGREKVRELTEKIQSSVKYGYTGSRYDY